MDLNADPQPTPEAIQGPEAAAYAALAAPVTPAGAGTATTQSAVTTPPAAEVARGGGWRRTVATAILAGGLLIVGGASAVFAASPDPSAATTPSATQGTAPSGHMAGNCPNMGTNGSTSSPSTSG